MKRTRIAIVGLGRAGRARVRALADHPRADLAAVVRRDPAAGEMSFAELLADGSIDAACVCTPNALHARQAEALLTAGKHVAVEFPVAIDADSARALYARAGAAGRVLHVEHIELLSPAHAVQVERVKALGAPCGGELYFSGDLDGWLADPALAGPAPLLAVARLHRLVDLFGPAEVSAAILSAYPDRYRLEIDLRFTAGGVTRLVEERGAGVRRTMRYEVECAGGPLGDPPPTAPAGLFRQDLDRFLDRIDGAPPYVSDERVLHVLDLVAEAEARLR